MAISLGIYPIFRQTQIKFVPGFLSSGNIHVPLAVLDVHSCSTHFWAQSGLVEKKAPPNLMPNNISGSWFGTCFMFPYIGNVIIPTDYIIFQRG